MFEDFKYKRRLLKEAIKFMFRRNQISASQAKADTLTFFLISNKIV